MPGRGEGGDCRNGSISCGRAEMKASPSRRPGRPRRPWQQTRNEFHVHLHGNRDKPSTEGERKMRDGEAEERAKSWAGERGKKAFEVREDCCGCEWCSLVEVGSGSWSGHCLEGNEGGMRRWRLPSRRKSRSRSGSGKGVACGGDLRRLCSEGDVRKVKRSLRLVGLELSEFGIHCEGAERSDGRKAREQCSTFRTKVAGRSVSLERVRELVRRTWAEEGLDESHRRLLARAAYEEWYFRKEGELRREREGERLRSAKAAGRLREEMERKKEKSEEEFKKWLERKKTKRKEKQESKGKGKEKPLRVLMKSREEIEEAFLKWKKGKDEELKKRKRERKKEEDKKKDLEKQKAEKKAAAEKAFLLWKSKLEENERAEEEKRQKRKTKKEEMERRRKGEESDTSFQVWREAKDRQMKDKLTQMRRAERAARQERLAQMEERMYEADQAFEDWLEKVDSRKHFYSLTAFQKPAPWIPA